jgi:hypothetical protein
MLPSPSSSHHRKITHFLSVWNSGHLDFVFTTVVRVVRKGFCCSLDGHGGFGPEKATLCSEIIQNPGERVTGSILVTVVGVVGKGFCCSPDGFGPENDTLCSEAPDENALVQCRGWIIIILLYLTLKRKNQCTASKGKSGKRTESK